MQAIAEAVRASNLCGRLRCLEDELFRLEFTSKTSEQSLILQKIQERIPSCKFFQLEGINYIVSPEGLCSYLKRAGPKGLTQKDFQKLLTKCKYIRSNNQRNLIDLLFQLLELGHPIDCILGLNLPLESRLFHYIREKSRLEHSLGLADAVHMSLFNLGISVRFPWKTRVSYRQLEDGHKKTFRPRVHFRTLDSRPSCLVTRGKTSNRKFILLLHYLRVLPKGMEEKDYVKLIKLSLTGLFSEKMDQELPEGYPEKSIPIFPPMTQSALDRNLRSNPKLRVRLYFNLIQSKSLCAPVGQDMIDESYEKHRKSLCRPEEECLVVPDDLLNELYQYGLQVGKELREHYQPFETSEPNTRSTIEADRSSGGTSGALQGQRTICQGSRFRNILSKEVRNQGPQRIEPFVIGLIGRPGCGKTTTLKVLVGTIRRKFFPEIPEDQLVYSRSCSMKHWDGYENQPVVILDDFGQNLEDRSDIVEFEQLVSTNRYPLPMADLKDKGRLFNSPIIILTTNCGYGTNFNVTTARCVVEDPVAVWRRISIPLYVESPRSFHLIDRDATLFNDKNMNVWSRKFNTTHTHLSRSSTFPKAIVTGPDDLEWSQSLPRGCRLSQVNDYVVERFRSHIEYNEKFLAPEWCQRITSQRVRYEINPEDTTLVNLSVEPVKTPYLKEDFSRYQTFSTLPPPGSPRVKACALSEPLKVRMITIAEAETKVLQPLQKGLFKVLQGRPQFCLSNGCSRSMLWKDFLEEGLPWIERVESQVKGIYEHSNEDDLWLSGDYTAATDNFPMSVTWALWRGIAESIDHPATLAWVEYEFGQHVINYPHGRTGVQTSGQLMGSLLSFPLLCFLNDFIVSKAGFQPGTYLINGDDVVARGRSEAIEKWRDLAPRVGLSLSLGKNFIDRHFCTVNSQLFYDGNCLHTGKVSCQTRLGSTIGFCYQETQFYFGIREEVRREFVRRNIIPLRRTVRSLKVPTTHGGLALAFDPCGLTSKEREFAKRTYLHDVLSPFLSSVPVPGFSEKDNQFGGTVLRGVPIPCRKGEGEESQLTLSRLQSLFGDPSPDNDTDPCDLSRSQVEGIMKKVKQRDADMELDRLLSIPFRFWPSMKDLDLEVKYIFVQEKRVAEILRLTVPLVLRILIHSLSNAEPEFDSVLPLIVEEIDFPVLTGKVASWIQEHFHDPPEEVVEDIDPDFSFDQDEYLQEYDVQPVRSLPDEVWLKSLLQIKEFAAPLPPPQTEE